MVLPKSSALRGSIRSFTLKRVGAQARTNLRAVGRRGYASEHGETKSSDLPWIIGSVAVTVPAATWLWSQGPTKSDHGHADEGHAEEEPKEATEEQSSQEEPEEKGEDAKEEGGDEGGRSETSEEETTAGSLPPGESKVSEKQGDKGAKKDVSGASNPFMSADEESKKPEGMAASAKITGTVDPSRPTSGHKGSGETDEKGEDDKSDN
ncbi:hypothetical protein A1O1_09181 [Capronia coronata CBS 617.96]|uniref:Uncharacterized protein n=1 Tax=Capronia coronata CBS 617.96 TaxID=1182541 RepID=W9Y8Q2_9EURO|nr:uncharacterized protein A1O1_09181 [Capronia coronata CBS 617.96]EXJ78779.1 hypothetical protein A1O1_09181 [Capronia coronata CBS 617.96]